jgi:hypothetical protein
MGPEMVTLRSDGAEMPNGLGADSMLDWLHGQVFLIELGPVSGKGSKQDIGDAYVYFLPKQLGIQELSFRVTLPGLQPLPWNSLCDFGRLLSYSFLW